MTKNGRLRWTGSLLHQAFFGSVPGRVDTVWWHSPQRCEETKNQKWASQLPDAFIQFPSLAGSDFFEF